MNPVIHNSNTYYTCDTCDTVYKSPKIDDQHTAENVVDSSITISIKDIIKMIHKKGNLTTRLFGYECVGLYSEIHHIDIIVDTVNCKVLITANCDDNVMCGALSSEYLDSPYYALVWHTTLAIQIKKGVSTYTGKINALYDTYAGHMDDYIIPNIGDIHVCEDIGLLHETLPDVFRLGVENQCLPLYKNSHKKRKIV
jgi:hypothetical protein